MNRNLMRVGSLALSLCLAVGTASMAAKKAPIEKYQANAISVGGAGGNRSAVLQMNIYEWSTDEDREMVIDAIKEATENARAYRAVPDALRKLGKAGYMFLAGGQGWPIRYARAIESGGKRTIVLVTDRPVTFAEVYAGSAVRDYDITIIALTFDGDGPGAGLASVGTEVQWNDTENRIEVTNYSSQPVKLGDVRKID